MKLYLTANKEILERTVRDGYGDYWRKFKKELAEFDPEYPPDHENFDILYEMFWPPEDDESCLEFTIELAPQQIEMYCEPGSDPRCREFHIPFELLVHAPFRLLTEAEIIAGIRGMLDVPDPRDGHTFREFLRQKLAKGEASRYERAALEDDEQWSGSA